MSQSRSNPALNKAISYIKEKLEINSWQAGECLPPSRILARQAGVSPDTMIRAIASLKKMGLVNSVERGRIRAGDVSSTPISGIKNDDKVWNLKRSTLESDILSGRYAHQDRLPQMKQLQERYGVCFRTLRKILRAMVSDGVLDLRGKWYHLSTEYKQAENQRIVFITYHVQAVPQSAINPQEYRILDLLERECMSRGLKLEIVEIDFYDPVVTRRMISSPAISDGALGYILDLWWYPGQVFQESHINLLNKLVALKQPVSILDEYGTFILPYQFSGNPFIQVFRAEGKRAGARMARMLLGMGHRSIAFISSLHDVFWSRQRLEGAAEEFSKAGCANGFFPVARSNIEINHEQILALSSFDDGTVKRILAANGTRQQAEEAFKAFQDFKKTFSSSQFDEKEIVRIQAKLSVIGDLINRNAAEELFNQVCRTVLTDEIGMAVALKVRKPLFTRALANPGITAWICANDNIALSALEHLQNQGIPVPQKISVAGFDNLPIKALEHRLTTFDFNAHGFIHRMLNHIARTPRPRGPYRHSVIEVEGIVMQRDTTAPVRSHNHV